VDVPSDREGMDDDAGGGDDDTLDQGRAGLSGGAEGNRGRMMERLEQAFCSSCDLKGLAKLFRFGLGWIFLRLDGRSGVAVSDGQGRRVHRTQHQGSGVHHPCLPRRSIGGTRGTPYRSTLFSSLHLFIPAPLLLFLP
jgi:hypothetical protein